MAFTPRVKIALLAASVLAFLLVVLLVVLPTVLVNRPETRAALQQRLGAMLGGEVAFDRVKLTLFPRVCATVGHPRLELPDQRSARAVEIDVCLKFLPLLQGRVVADSIKVQSPEIHLPIVPIDSPVSGPGFPDPQLLLKQMAGLVKQVPESTIEVTAGRVELDGAGGHRFEFRNLNLRFQHDGDRLEWSLQSESDLFKAFSSSGRLETDSLKGTITFKVTDFRPRPLQAFFLPATAFQVLETRVDVDVAVSLEGPERATVAVAGRAPALALGYNRRETLLSVDRFAVQVELAGDRLAVSVPEFISLTPQASLELTFVIDEKVHPKIDLDLKGRGNLAGARDFTLAMLHEIPEVLLVCDIMRSGEVSHIHVNLHGDSWDELADLNNLLIKGRLENGRVYLPWIDLDLNAVSGDVLIAGGILEGQDLKGHYKGTRGENGTLRIGLAPADPVIELDIPMHADLAPLPAILARVIPEGSFRAELRRIEAFTGTATGRLQLNGSLDNVGVRVDAADIAVAARYQRLPLPLTFTGGRFLYDGPSIEVRDLDVRVGSSTLTRLSLRLGLDAGLPLTAASPAAAIELADLLHLFGDHPPLAFLTSLEGTAGFQEWELAGSAADPQTWEIRSSGSVRKLQLASELLPGPVRVDQAPFVWDGRHVRAHGWTLAIGGSRMDVASAGLDWTGDPVLDLAASRVDASVADLLWFLSSRPDLAAHLEPFAPLSGTATLRDAHSRVAFPPGAGARVDVSADLDSAQITSRRVPEPLRLDSGRLHWQGSSLEVDDLNVALGASGVHRLSLAVDWGAGDRYEIRTDAAAIECGEVYPWLSLLPGLRGLRENISGIQGNVEVAGFGLSGRISGPLNWNLRADSRLNHMVITTTFLEEPIRIRLGKLRAEETATATSGGTVLRVEDLQTSTGSNRVMASGEIRLAPEDIALDLTLTAESIDWNEIQTLSDRLSRRRPTEGRPVKGRIGLRAEAFKIGSYDFHPLMAEAVLTPGGTTVAIERADLCGIVLIGRLTFASGRLNAYIVPVADNTLLDTTITCLSEEKSMASGRFNLDGSLQVNAPPAEFMKALTGNIEAISENGRLLRSNLFAKILGLINITELYRGTIPDLTGEGLEYKRTKLSGEFRDGKLIVNSWALDGPSLWMGARGEVDLIDHTLQLFVLVSPFKTVDRIINVIPGLRWVLGGRLVAIPMEARGDLFDPEVIPLAPTAVGQSILDMLGRTLLLPLHIIQPLIPGLDESVDIDGASIVQKK